MTTEYWFYLIAGFNGAVVLLLLILLARKGQTRDLQQELAKYKLEQMQQQSAYQQQLLEQFHLQRQQLQKQQQEQLLQILQKINDTQQAGRFELSKNLQQQAQLLAEQVKQLTQSVDQRLKDIAGQVERRLADGFEKTNQTFTDIVKRLALIDDAQKKITELSTNVVSLQEVLADKRSRGAFGEVQLTALIRNVLPEQHFALQHTLTNGRIADCMLFLPKPSGDIAIDAKFPLESYKRMTDATLGAEERKQAQRQFKLDIKKHINDIADKYIIANETADGAIMFLPAEAIFAELHAYHADLVEEAYRRRVWLTSPTTLMAVLTTARSVLKDDATRRQVHLIQEHLLKLAEDFSRFRGRFDNLAKHIDQAAVDVKQIHTSAHKISSRFSQIEQVEWLEDTEK
ncbi:MAG TPA: DNA recombination protein RmuC [Rheinheimera sp.]|nr:DNA recombination protein RmuC [Rheinheimera sp.]